MSKPYEIELLDEWGNQLKPPGPEGEYKLCKERKPVWQLGDNYGDVFRKHYPNYQNDRPLTINEVLNIEFMHMGMPRGIRRQFAKFMNHHSAEVRKKGLALLLTTR